MKGLNTFPKVLRQDRRSVPDRRAHATSFLSLFRFHGRRSGFRRAGEKQNKYVDCVSGRAVTLVLLIMVFSILDAFTTFYHLGQGAREINPVMRMVIRASPSIFFVLKGLGIGLATAFLAIHQNFRISLPALHGLAATYLIVLAYQMVLLLRQTFCL